MGTDWEASFESLTVPWVSPVLTDVASSAREGVGVAASVRVWPMPSATGVLVDTLGSGLTGDAAGPQARENNNIKLDREAYVSAFRFSTGRIMADIRSLLCDGNE